MCYNFNLKNVSKIETDKDKSLRLINHSIDISFLRFKLQNDHGCSKNFDATSCTLMCILCITQMTLLKAPC